MWEMYFDEMSKEWILQNKWSKCILYRGNKKQGLEIVRDMIYCHRKIKIKVWEKKKYNGIHKYMQKCTVYQWED